MRKWRDDERDKVLQLFDKGGLSYAEIGRAVGRTGSSVQTMIQRHRLIQVREHNPFSCYDGPPIARCLIAERLAQNAIEGSTRLAAEIQRVFGRAAA